MPFSTEPASGATSWYAWGTDVHNLTSNAMWEPVQRYLPVGYVAGTTDIAPYVQAAINAIDGEGRGFIRLPPGTHFWNSPVYCINASQDMSYAVHGHGKGTTINLGAGLNGDFALYVNRNSSGAQVVASPGFPRMWLADLTIAGPSSTTTASMIFTDMGSCKVERIKCTLLYRLVQVANYTDLMEFRKIRWQVNVTGSAMYYNHANGDGLTIEDISSNPDALVCDLDGCNGGTLKGLVGGRVVFNNCDAITIVSTHIDTKDPGNYTLLNVCQVTDSRVRVIGGWDHVSPNAPTFEINDSDPAKGSELTIDGWTFGFRSNVSTKLRAPSVKVTAAVDQTRLRLRNCSGRVTPVGSPTRYSVGPLFNSPVAAIQAAWDAYPTALLEDVDLVKLGGTWKFVAPPPDSGRNFLRIATAPVLAAASTTIDPGDAGAGTYFYKVATYTDKARGLHTAVSTEASVTLTTGTQAVQLQITPGVTPALVRIWRGTTTGTYTRYVDVPLAGATTYINDTGTTMQGYAWITTAVPTPPTTNTTMDGQVVGASVQFLGGAAPTEGTWATGDRVNDTTPAAGASAWICTAGGTPGTWVAI